MKELKVGDIIVVAASAYDVRDGDIFQIVDARKNFHTTILRLIARLPEPVPAPEADIIDRILNKKSEFIERYNEDPLFVYLGEKEYAELNAWRTMHREGITVASDKIDGMSPVKVHKESWLAVG